MSYLLLGITIVISLSVFEIINKTFLSLYASYLLSRLERKIANKLIDSLVGSALQSSELETKNEKTNLH